MGLPRPNVTMNSMSTRSRYIAAIAIVVFGLHSILSLTHETYGRATSLSHLTASNTSSPSYNNTAAPSATPVNPYAVPDYYYVEPAPSEADMMASKRANATLVMLARNTDLEGVVSSMRRLEDRFNRNYQYPWVFLNEVEFTEDFKRRVSVLTDANVTFGVIPKDHWYQPDWIDEERATEGRNKLVQQNIIYGGSVPYRNMCRYNSGFFYRHELLLPYRWYWRVEPDVDFMCNIDFDPFVYMEEHNKTYGFTIALREFRETVETLWDATKEFMSDHPEYVAPDNAMGFLSDDNGNDYNLCHFWSNFEIADMDFWRGEAYSAYFEHLDSKGGFYYERWGDAPVHSIAAGLFLPRSKLHFFDPIGYKHEPFNHCPSHQDSWAKSKCSCNPAESFDYAWYSCKRVWDRQG